MSLRSTLGRHVWRFLPHYGLGLVLLFATNWLAVRIPTIVGAALNVLQDGGQAALASSRGLAVELMICAFALVFVRTASRVLFFNPGREIEQRLGDDLFSHLLALQRPFYRAHKVGELGSVVSNDLLSVRLLVGFAALQVCNVVVAIPLHLWQMARTDALLTLWCCLPIAAGALFMRWSIGRFYGLIRVSMRDLGKLSDRVLESYAGIATLRSFAAEEAAVARFQAKNREYLALQMGLAKMRSFALPVLGLTGLLGAAIVLWVGGAKVARGELRIGDLATFTALLLSMVALLTSLAWVFASISMGWVALGRVDALLDAKADVPVGTATLSWTRPPSVHVSGLSHCHVGGGRPALEGIDFMLAPGKTLGIFGATGAGKTTLIDLLAGLERPPEGTIQIDGVRVEDLSLAELRRGLAVVPQEAFLFSTTLRDNIRLRARDRGEMMTVDAVGDPGLRLLRVRGERGASTADAEVDDALDPLLASVLEQTALTEDLRQLPEGLDTVVGERGVILSGGQRQRTAIARALYREPKLLLLDDVLSAVDQRTEARLVAAIRGIGAGASAPTTVIVSHRTSVLEHADEILVLEHGRVVERGTHAELLAAGGRYAAAHRHQHADAQGGGHG